jgi:uncharacterized OB-fold protein
MTIDELSRVDEGLASAPVYEVVTGGVALVGSACTRCGAVAFPRRVICIRCGGPHVERVLKGTGSVHSWTTIANPPHGFYEEITYGCIDLDEGPRVMAPLADTPPDFGARVRVVPGFGRLGAAGFRFEACDA